MIAESSSNASTGDVAHQPRTEWLYLRCVAVSDVIGHEYN